MSRRLANITLDNLDDLPRRCRSCAFWELDPVARTSVDERGDAAFEKEAWVSATLLEWGSCGKVVYVDGVAAGYAMFAPPAYVPRSVAFPTSPVSADAVLLMSAHVVPEFSGIGLGRMLVQGVAKDLLRRGVRAVEAATPAEEAQVIALALRRALVTPGRTAALVTPDRGLARRVAAHCRRWGLNVDDSAGTPLRLTTAEFDTLSALAAKPGDVRSREELTKMVFRRTWRSGDRAVDNAVLHLRQKLSQDLGDGCIVTVRQMGYVFTGFPKG